VIKYLKISALCCSLILIGPILRADEGMWMPHQMQDLHLKALGLQMDPSELYKKDGTGLMSAIVHLGGGTGEFVSAEGLILTNHHVAFGALQRASSTEHDYIQHGFIARKKNEEIEAKGYYADVLLGYDDITTQVQAVLKPGMTYKQQYFALDEIKKKIIAAAEKQGPDLRASVAEMYSGNKYYLYRFKRLKDIRLVYAPPLDLGNFGGDIDNWMWPRHTCDFTFLRAYVSPKNLGTEYNKDNVPYKPKSILKISLEGFKEGDFSFVMGYPGRTYRNYTLSQLKLDVEYMQNNILLRQDIIAFLDNAGQNDRNIQIKYASVSNSLNNYLKNYQGKIEGMQKVGLLKKKRQDEENFLQWVNTDPQRRKKYSGTLDNINAFMPQYTDHFWKDRLFSQLTSSRYGSVLLEQAYTIFRTAQERQKSDLERDPAYQERNIASIKQKIELAERGYDLQVDRALLKHQLKKLIHILPNQMPAAFKNILLQKSEKEVEKYVDRLYDGTTLTDPQKRLQYIEKTPSQLAMLNDPLLDLAQKLEQEMQLLREEKKFLEQQLNDHKKLYLEALLLQKEGRIAPDANSTIRFTYGFAKGYAPRDAVYYQSQTTLGGVVEKDTGEFPFLVPAKLKTLYTNKNFGRFIDKKLQDIPACFLNSTSVTGGNSGSPTLNAKGEQIGIIFDMTYESVTADYYIIPELQRTISVDIRYVLFVTEKFSGADFILKEIGL